MSQPTPEIIVCPRVYETLTGADGKEREYVRRVDHDEILAEVYAAQRHNPTRSDAAPGVTETRDSAAPALERRSFAVTEIRVERAEGKPPKIVGYAATFNSPSKPLPMTDKSGKTRTFVETIAPGAFTRALTDGRDIAALVGHQPNQIVSRSSSGKLTLTQDDKGLGFVLTPADTTRSADLLNDIDHGNIRGMSFGFGDDTADAWGKGTDGTLNRTLKDIDLREISFTPFPAYNDTTVGVRSLDALAELEKRDHPHDFSAVAEHARDAAGMCRSASMQMMQMRDLLDGMTGKPTDKEAKHVRDLHDSIRELSKRSMEVRDRTKKILNIAPDDLTPAAGGGEGGGASAGPNDGNDVARSLRLASYTHSTGLSLDQIRTVTDTRAKKRDADDNDELTVKKGDDGWYVIDSSGEQVKGPFDTQDEAQEQANEAD